MWLQGFDEQKISRKRVAKVRKSPKATADGMYYYLMPLLQKQPDNIFLLVRTNTDSSSNSSKIVKNILKLRSFISQKLPNTNVIFSKPNMRSNTAAGKAAKIE